MPLNRDDLDALEAALPHLSPEQLREAAALLKPSWETFFASLPTDTLRIVLQVMEVLALSRGAPPANCLSSPVHDAAVFLSPDGSPLPFDHWYDRRTGALLTEDEKADLGPLAADGSQVREVAVKDVLPLLPPALRDRLAAALARGYW
jgi:hypothetical protein